MDDPAAALLVWHRFPPEADAELAQWYDREHHPQRLALPGWRSVRRYRDAAGAPAIFSHYRVRALADLTSDAYLAQLREPTEWSRRMLPLFQEMSRTACVQMFESRDGDGGAIGTWRIGCEPERSAGLIDSLRSGFLAEALRRPGIVHATLLRGDAAATLASSRERKLRSGPERIVDVALLIGANDPEPLAPLRRATLSDEALFRLGARDVSYGEYRFVFGLTAP
jgi:hypothetical protein